MGHTCRTMTYVQATISPGTSILQLEDVLVVAGGGGGDRVGVSNQLLLYDISDREATHTKILPHDSNLILRHCIEVSEMICTQSEVVQVDNTTTGWFAAGGKCLYWLTLRERKLKSKELIIFKKPIVDLKLEKSGNALVVLKDNSIWSVSCDKACENIRGSSSGAITAILPHSEGYFWLDSTECKLNHSKFTSTCLNTYKPKFLFYSGERIIIIGHHEKKTYFLEYVESTGEIVCLSALDGDISCYDERGGLVAVGCPSGLVYYGTVHGLEAVHTAHELGINGIAIKSNGESIYSVASDYLLIETKIVGEANILLKIGARIMDFIKTSMISIIFVAFYIYITSSNE